MTSDKDKENINGGEQNGMYFYSYVFVPQVNATITDIVNLLLGLDINVSTEMLERIPEEIHEHFVEKDEDVFHFHPFDDITLDHIVVILKQIGVSLNASAHNRIPDEAKKHFNLVYRSNNDYSYVFEPKDDISVRDVVMMMGGMDIHLSKSGFENVPENTRKHFVLMDRMGKQTRYGSRLYRQGF